MALYVSYRQVFEICILAKKMAVSSPGQGELVGLLAEAANN